MNKKLILSTLLIPLVGLLSGCGGGGTPVDPTKTQIGIKNWGGGYGTAWLKDITEKYAELVKDVSFEEGKKGVQFTLTQTKEHMTTVAQIKGLTAVDVIFDEGVVYNMWSTQSALKDISDLVTETNPYDSTKKSIADKMSESQKSGLLRNGKYYAIPTYMGSYGINYNKELYNSQKMYLGSEGWCDASDANISAGPDGVKGTYDDGLPVTNEDFLKVCQRAKSKGLVPIIGAGSTASYYVPALCSNIAASYDGLDASNGRLTSKSNNVTIMGDTETAPTSSINITESNGYELMRSKGIYKSFNLLEKLFKEGYMIDYDDEISTLFNSSVTHLAAQKYFINKCHNDKQALMLIEGDWWFNEAEVAVKQKYGTDLSAAKFGKMPLLRNEGQTENVVWDSLAAHCYVREGSAASKWKAIKDFLFYVYSDAGMNNFTRITNTRWNLNYTITQEVKDSLHPFGKSLMEFYESDHTHVLSTLSQDSFFTKNEGILTPSNAKYLQTNAASNIVNHLYASGKFNTTAFDYTMQLQTVWKNKGIWGK